MNISLAFSEAFLSALTRLPSSQQKKTERFITNFRKNPKSPGINFERIRDASSKHLCSARIDHDYRIIVQLPLKGNVYMLLWVDKHDEAYAWARRYRVAIHPDKGGIQIYPVHDVTSGKEKSSLKESQGLFRKWRDRQLVRVGVPRDLVELVRSFENKVDLEDHKKDLPYEAYEALNYLASDIPYEEIVATNDPKNEIDTEDFDAALDNPHSRQQFVVIKDDVELQKILHEPLEKWRVFLHPSQQRIVTMQARGPIRVLGGAGTGKTVVAMHRAKQLASEIFTDTNDRILFTTFTKNLAADIAANLKTICNEEAFQRIEIVNLDKWAVDKLQALNASYRIAYSDTTKKVWEDVFAELPDNMPYSKKFYEDEFNRVVLANEIDNERDYLRVRRTGRGHRLTRLARKDIWPVFVQYRNRLLEQNLREREDAYRDLRIRLQESSQALPYKSVLVDEAQDMTAGAMRLIRQIIPEETDNDLFIVGDAHQRIYGRPIVMSRCGINIRGRSHRLRINYRTPEEIRNWAICLLKNIPFDDMDGGEDTLKGYHSLIRGIDPPKVQHFPGFKEEVDAIIAHINTLGSPENHRDICLVVRTNNERILYDGALQSGGITTYRITPESAENRKKPGVRIATMHRVKGLEFDHMIAAGINKDKLPLGKALAAQDNPKAREYTRKQERSLLYVAATRAKKSLLVTSYGKKSPFLP